MQLLATTPTQLRQWAKNTMAGLSGHVVLSSPAMLHSMLSLLQDTGAPAVDYEVMWKTKRESGVQYDLPNFAEEPSRTTHRFHSLSLAFDLVLLSIGFSSFNPMLFHRHYDC